MRGLRGRSSPASHSPTHPGITCSGSSCDESREPGSIGSDLADTVGVGLLSRPFTTLLVARLGLAVFPAGQIRRTVRPDGGVHPNRRGRQAVFQVHTLMHALGSGLHIVDSLPQKGEGKKGRSHEGFDAAEEMLTNSRSCTRQMLSSSPWSLPPPRPSTRNPPRPLVSS